MHTTHTHEYPKPNTGLFVTRVGHTPAKQIPLYLHRLAQPTALAPSHVSSHRFAVPGLTSWEGGGKKREGYFPAVNSWFEDGASLLQIDLIFPCPKMALRSTSSSALQHWLCPAPVLNPGRLRQTICKNRQTAVPYNLYSGESLITDFHSQMIFLYRNAIWKYKFSDLLHKYLRITLMGQQKLYQLKSCPVTPTGFIGLNSVSF